MKQENNILDIQDVLRKNTVAKRLKIFDFNIFKGKIVCKN